MHETNLRNFDLNLLVILKELLRYRNVTHAAVELGMSQPAVSRSLQKLRELLNDELLVRTNKTYELSSRAKSLEKELDQLLASIKNIILEPSFDPKNSHETLLVQCQDPEVIAFLPEIYMKLQQEAPNMKLKVIEQSGPHFELLNRGEVHFEISAAKPTHAPLQLYQMKLASTGFASVMRKGHPLSKGRFTLKKYLSANHAIISITGKGLTDIDRRIEKLGKKRNVSLTLSNFSSVAHICESSDTISLMPARIAKEVCKGRDLILIDPPSELELEDINFGLYWHARFHNDPMCRWFKKLISNK